MTSLIKTILLLTVFLIPLIGAYGNFGYEQIKVLVFIILATLSGFLWMGKGFKWSAISKAGGIFIALLLFTSFIGINPFQSILGAQPYFQGAVLYAYLYLFSLMVSSVKIKFETWANIMVSSAMIVAALAIKDWILLNVLHQQISTYAGRVVSTFGQPNFYAGFILLALPFFYFLMTKKETKWYFILGFLISIVAIILSESRTAYLILAGLMIFWLGSELLGKKILVFGVVLISIVIFLSVFFTSGLFWKEVVEPQLSINPDLTKSSVENRVYIWPISWKLILQKPLLGYGLENISQAFSDYFTVQKHALFEENLKISPVLISLKELNIDRSHNYLLDLLLFSGVLGLLGWLGIVWVMIKRAKGALLISLILYLIWIQFQNQSVVHLIYFWLLVGMIDKGSVNSI